MISKQMSELPRSQTDLNLLEGLEQPARNLMTHHLTVAKVCYPSDAIPPHEYDPSKPWSPSDYPLSPGVRSALVVNTLTEDNLPYYTHNILNIAHPDHALHEWTHRWTAEEARHSDAMRHWILATGALNPRALEDDRMQQMTRGEVPTATNIPDTIAYVSFQELATNIAHRNTGRRLGKERGGLKVMSLVAGDENLHHEFYKNLVVAALDIEPSAMILAVRNQMKTFKMPGTGIKDFPRHEKAISDEGIFTEQIVMEQVFLPTIHDWKPAIQAAKGLSAAANQARDRILGKFDQVERIKAIRTYRKGR
jgi:acyl-[acyl-carrier-protein] desaturase